MAPWDAYVTLYHDHPLALGALALLVTASVVATYQLTKSGAYTLGAFLLLFVGSVTLSQFVRLGTGIIALGVALLAPVGVWAVKQFV